MELFEDKSKGATFSEDGKHRFQLWRIWDDKLPKVLFIMLNPSTADAEMDDPTIRRCIGFAKSWGYGGFYVGNLFTYRSKTPNDLFMAETIIHWGNKSHIKTMHDKCKIVVCAWGNSKIVDKLCPPHKPLEGFTNCHYIELSNDGTPKHPLYLKGDLMPQKYEIV